MHSRQSGFTLIELLVVVTIIVVLLALLIPAVEGAMDAAFRAKCLTNQRTVVLGCHQYSLQNNAVMPSFQMNGKSSSAWDLRSWDTAGTLPRIPLGIGLLVPSGFLSSTQLGQVVHCPKMNNLGSPVRGHCMDVNWGGGRGGSWWNENPDYRIVMGFNYRGASFYRVNQAELRTSEISSAFVVLMDTLDVRMRGVRGRYAHREGYNRIFGDGSGAFFFDAIYEVERIVTTATGGSGVADGLANGGRHDEQVFAYLSTDK